MNDKPSINEILEAAVRALNGRDPTAAAGLALEALSRDPQNQDAMTVLGAARFAALCNPHDTFFAKLKTLGFTPRAAVDIGAYEGHWTAALKRTFAATEVLMLEAQPGKADTLRALSDRHQGVRHRICLVGDRNEDAVAFHVMDTPFGSTGSSIYPEQTSYPRDAVPLTMYRLDDILAEAGPAAPNLLKIDVQGAELDVLAGAVKTLETVELIHMELSVLQYNAGAPLITEVLPRLDAAGFVLFDILEEHRIGDGTLSQLDALFVAKGSALRPAGALF